MKKYYIPTSSLNFNNILSSESISPKAFYQARSFGYGRWISIPENPFENSVVLYDELHSFIRPSSVYEDHPLLIEVVFDEANESTFYRLGDHIFLCDRTIYIDPYTTRLIFFSENDKRIALSMSESSIETKFVSLYIKKINVMVPPASGYALKIDGQDEKQKINNDEIAKDQYINRMKGLLYGYYVGALLSASTKEDIVKLNKAREIRNILAAILSSIDHMATSQQRNRLNNLYKAIQPPIPLKEKLLEVVPDELIDKVLSIVREEYGRIRGEYDVEKIIYQLLRASSDDKNPAIEDINARIWSIESDILKNAHEIQVEERQVVVCNGSLMQLKIAGLPDKDKKLYLAWVNEVLTMEGNTGKISAFKEKLSDDITMKAKEVCEKEWKEEWRGSSTEVTLNALRHHIRGSEYSHVWGNDIYSYISALLICGDDWQKLLEYMQGKEMTDYRLVYAMYGAINGFANLHRDFTDVLLGLIKQNEYYRNYIDKVYKEFYRQLFGREVKSLKESKNDVSKNKPQSKPTECGKETTKTE